MLLLSSFQEQALAAAVPLGCVSGIAAGAAAAVLFPGGQRRGLLRLAAEAAAGAVFFCFAAAGAENFLQLAFVWQLTFFLLIHCFTDYDCCLLSDMVTLALAVTGVCYSMDFGGLPQAFWGAAAAGGVMLAVYLACSGGMGFGDVKLAAALGLWLGPELGLLMLFLACASGGIPAFFMLLLRLRRPGDAVPFGPFICAGALAAIICGRGMLDWYYGFF